MRKTTIFRRVEFLKKYRKFHSTLHVKDLLDIFDELKKIILGNLPITLVIVNTEWNQSEILYSDHGLEPSVFFDWAYIDPYNYLIYNDLKSFYDEIPLPWNEKRNSSGIILLRFLDTDFGYALIGDDNTHLTRHMKDLLEQLLFEFSSAFVRIKFYDNVKEEAQNYRLQLDALSEMGNIMHEFRIKPLLARITNIGIKVIDAEVAAICLKNDNSDTIDFPVEWGLTRDVVNNINFADGENIVSKILAEESTILIKDVTSDECLNVDSLSVDIGSIIALPLKTQRQMLGVFILVNKINQQSFTEYDVNLIETASSLASIALENALLYQNTLIAERLENEMCIARNIQQDFLPKTAPKIKNLNIEGFSWSCDQTGGDYFDFYEKSNNDSEISIVIGDVSGHGVGSALIMAYAKALMQALQTTIDNDLLLLFKSMNELLYKVTPADRFMTFLLAKIDARKKEMKYVSAGHDSPILLRSSGKIELLDSTGPPLGMFPAIDWEQSNTIKLNSGDIIVFTTDGVWEGRNYSNKSFSRERLYEVVKDYAKLNPKDIINNIFNEVQNFVKPLPLQDDVTLIVCKVD